MRITKIAAMVLLSFATLTSQAAFIDQRGAAEVEVSYRAISMEDFLSEIVPKSYSVEFANPALRSRQIAAKGKGPWDAVLTSTAQRNGIAVVVMPAEKRVVVSEIGAVAVGGVALQPGVQVRPAQVVVVQPVAPTQVYKTANTDYQVSAVVQRWATQANMQLVWEPRDVDYKIRAEHEWGTDFRTSLTDLLISVQGARERVRACIHPNKPKNVVRIIHFNERCKGTI